MTFKNNLGTLPKGNNIIVKTTFLKRYVSCVSLYK